MKPENVRGSSYSTQEFEKAFKVEYKLNAQYSWDSGYAISKYLAGLKGGKILGIKCHKCQRILLPPRAFCEECFIPIDEWIELKDSGVVNTFSISYVATDVTRLKEPQIPAVIEIDGASAGIAIMHLLGEVKPSDVKIGMRVKAMWKPPNEREGAITDIKYFKPE